MTTPLVCGLRSVEIGVPEVAAAEKFYVETWLLTVAARSANTVYLRGTGAAHHLLSINPVGRCYAARRHSPSRFCI